MPAGKIIANLVKLDNRDCWLLKGWDIRVTVAYALAAALVQGIGNVIRGDTRILKGVIRVF